MILLLLGLSNIAKKRILPAAIAAGFDTIEVASRTATEDSCIAAGISKVYPSYEAGLAQSRADVVYVTTVNSLHAELTETALQRGFHVIVDKPAFLSLSDTQRLLELAARNGRCLAEATVWQYHPRIKAALQIFEDEGSRPTQIVSTFSFPPLPESDFRYQADLGGGALWDLGPYAMTPGRVFFSADPIEVTGRCTSTKDNVETGFSVLGLYPEGASLVGSFGYTTGYVNRLQILGPGISVTMDRIFSPPAQMNTELIVHSRESYVLPVPPADNFELFLKTFMQAIEEDNYAAFAADMKRDAESIHYLRYSALT